MKVEVGQRWRWILGKEPMEVLAIDDRNGHLYAETDKGTIMLGADGGPKYPGEWELIGPSQPVEGLSDRVVKVGQWWATENDDNSAFKVVSISRGYANSADQDGMIHISRDGTATGTWWRRVPAPTNETKPGPRQEAPKNPHKTDRYFDRGNTCTVCGGPPIGSICQRNDGKDPRAVSDAMTAMRMRVKEMSRMVTDARREALRFAAGDIADRAARNPMMGGPIKGGW